MTRGKTSQTGSADDAQGGEPTDTSSENNGKCAACEFMKASGRFGNAQLAPEVVKHLLDNHTCH